jgi:hypothetical protein
VHSLSGFASGVKGITPPSWRSLSWRSAQAFMIFRDAKSRKRYESIVIGLRSTPYHPKRFGNGAGDLGRSLALYSAGVNLHSCTGCPVPATVPILLGVFREI